MEMSLEGGLRLQTQTDQIHVDKAPWINNMNRYWTSRLLVFLGKNVQTLII